MRKKRNRVRVLGGNEDQCAEWSQNVTMDDEHKRIFDAYKETGYILDYNPDLKMWHGHTAALKKVFKILGLKGFFDTETDDTDPAMPNCYWFLRPNGHLFVVRINSSKEHWSWGHTDTEKREACCYYNAPIDLQTACKAVGGVWGGDFAPATSWNKQPSLRNCSGSSCRHSQTTAQSISSTPIPTPLWRRPHKSRVRLSRAGDRLQKIGRHL